MPIDTGGPAYASTVWKNQIGSAAYPPLVESQHCGMTLLDHFAALAMQAIVSTYTSTARPGKDSPTTGCHNRELMIDKNHKTGEFDGANEIAEDAYTIARAMLAEKRRLEATDATT